MSFSLFLSVVHIHHTITESYPEHRTNPHACLHWAKLLCQLWVLCLPFVILVSHPLLYLHGQRSAVIFMKFPGAPAFPQIQRTCPITRIVTLLQGRFICHTTVFLKKRYAEKGYRIFFNTLPDAGIYRTTPGE
jgi:hypothetical protein